MVVYGLERVQITSQQALCWWYDPDVDVSYSMECRVFLVVIGLGCVKLNTRWLQREREREGQCVSDL